jgi:TPR repeat protein
MRLLSISSLLFLFAALPAAAEPLGDGVAAYKAKDWPKAVELLQPLAEQGNALAEETMGRMSERGVGVKRDYEAAALWYRKAAEQGNAAGQARLATMLRIGMGPVKRDPPEAAKWFAKSAAQGNPLAQVGLGYMSLEGLGMPADAGVAADWLTKAANQGDASAMLGLGTLYDLGKGVTKDPAQAYKWYSLATVDDGEYDQDLFDRAKRLRDGLMMRMTPVDLGRGEEMVKGFKKK